MDSISGEPDYSRPANPWFRLLLAGFLLLLVLVGFGYCTSQFFSTPDPVVRIEATEVQEGLPRFVPIPVFGADTEGSTYGVWIVVTDDQIAGYVSYGETGCHVRWDPVSGIFSDSCTEASYDIGGSRTTPSSGRDLHEVIVRYDPSVLGRYVIDLEYIYLARCVANSVGACSTGDDDEKIPLPASRISLVLD